MLDNKKLYKMFLMFLLMAYAFFFLEKYKRYKVLPVFYTLFMILIVYFFLVTTTFNININL